MEINLRLDTSQPGDLAALAKLSAAFNGSVATTVPAASKSATAPKTVAEPAPKTDTAPAQTAPATGGHVTIEQVRAVFATKVKADVMAAMKKLGIAGLSTATDDQLPGLLAAVNELPNK